MRPLALWRTWRVDGDQLVAPIWETNDAWVPGENTAHCRRHDHRAPDPYCGCGLYGYYQPQAGILPHPRDRAAIFEWMHAGGDEIETLQAGMELAGELRVIINQLYLWAARMAVQEEDNDGMLVEGVVLGWGTVEAHDLGARCQYAKPWGLLTDGVNGDAVTRIAQRYNMRAKSGWQQLILSASEWGQTLQPTNSP